MAPSADGNRDAFATVLWKPDAPTTVLPVSATGTGGSDANWYASADGDAAAGQHATRYTGPVVRPGADRCGADADSSTIIAGPAGFVSSYGQGGFMGQLG